MRTRRSHRLWGSVLTVVAVAATTTALLPSAEAATGDSVVAWCADEVVSVGRQVAPYQNRLGTQITTTVITTAAQRAEAIKTTGLDSTGLTLGSKRPDGLFQARMIIDCTEITSRGQQTALRFLILHEIAHTLQFISEANPNATSAEQHEFAADCAANSMMRKIYDTKLGLSYGAHGGCPAAMFEPTQAWLESVATAAPPVPTPPKRATGKMKSNVP